MKPIKLFALISFLGAGLFSLAGTGTLRGTVTDEQTGETLIGATISVPGTSIGTATDVDGQYSLPLEQGTYTILVSYISYDNLTVNEVVIAAGKVNVLDFRLNPSSLNLEAVVIEAKSLRNNEAALLTLQKKSANVMDGISSQAFTAMGDADAGAAMKRVTGVSVENGKYVYVRGLGDRYSKTTLNNMEIPGVDPERNSVQLDLFPTNLIDNIVVYKTFTPNLPGNFTGGLVDITTKDFPEKLTLQASASYGFNIGVSFNDNFLSYKGGKLDALGFDDGTRDFPIPLEYTLNKPVTSEQIQESADITRSFNEVMGVDLERSMMDQAYGFSVGNQFGEKNPLGLIFSLTYKNEYEHYDDGITGRYFLRDNVDVVDILETDLELRDTKSTNNILWGALLNTSMKFKTNHKIGLTLMHNQAGEKTARFQEGTYDIDNSYPFYRTQSLFFEQRGLSTAQLYGKHIFLDRRKMEVDWKGAFTYSQLSQPDYRFFTDLYSVEEGDTTFVVKKSNVAQPARYTRNMKEIIMDSKADFTMPYRQWGGLEAKARFGAAYLFHKRTYRDYRFDYGANKEEFSGDPDQYVGDDNVIDELNNPGGVYIISNYEKRNNYESDMGVAAVYAMTELPLMEQLKLVAGVRLEYTLLHFTSYSEDLQNTKGLNDKKLLNNIDPLPSVGLTYAITKQMNLRTSYARTLARPTFRELAPIATFDFAGDFVLVGNDELVRSTINNMDLRWEYYLKSNELISASFFYKNFNDPIEQVANPVANGEVTFRNVPKGSLFGFEVEVRKAFDFITPKLKDLFLGINASYIKSLVNIDIQELETILVLDPDADDKKPMFGQSPYIVNTYLEYANDKGTRVNVNYNVQGPRLSVVILGATPDVYEQPFHSLNLRASQEFGKKRSWKATVGVENLLNSKARQTMEYKDNDYIYQSYTTGRKITSSLAYSIR